MDKIARRITFGLVVAAPLAACQTMPPPASTPPQPMVAVIPPVQVAPPPPPAPMMVVPNPMYKVGDPYQIAGIWYYPKEQPDFDETGIASWYGADFHGMLTSNGEVFDRNGISAAHPTLPLPANVRVTNLENGRSIIVRLNDRGPFVRGRLVDLSEHAADLLGFKTNGTARVRVTFLGRADLFGPGLAPIAQQTPPEIANAVPAVPVDSVESAALPAIAGTRVAPPIVMASLPKPVQRIEIAPLEAVADGRVTEMPVPAATAIYVQAGAFSSAANAGAVAAKLSSVGAKVFPGKKEGLPIYRVRIGPFQAVDDADAVFSQVQALGHNDVQIVVEPAMS